MAKRATPEVEPGASWKLHLSNGRVGVTPEMSKADLLAHITEDRWIPILNGALVNPAQVVMVEEWS